MEPFLIFWTIVCGFELFGNLRMDPVTLKLCIFKFRKQFQGNSTKAAEYFTFLAPDFKFTFPTTLPAWQIQFYVSNIH